MSANNHLIDSEQRRIDLWQGLFPNNSEVGLSQNISQKYSNPIDFPWRSFQLDRGPSWSVTIPVRWHYDRHSSFDARFQIDLTDQDQGETLGQRAIAAIRRGQRAIAQIKPLAFHPVVHSLVPFNLCTDPAHLVTHILHPLTHLGQEALKAKKITHWIPRVLLGIITLIVDLATLVFRLVTLIPRAFYQCYHTAEIPRGMKFIATGYQPSSYRPPSNTINLKWGTIDVPTFEISENDLPNGVEMRITRTEDSQHYLGGCV